MSPAAHQGARVRLHDGTLVSLALDEPGGSRGERAELSAHDAGGWQVGRAAYSRVYGPRAELSIDVDDRFWHRGLPTLLIGSLRERAAAAGITTFLVTARASEVRLLALLSGDFGARCTRDGALVDIELACAQAAPAGDAPGAPCAPRQVGVRCVAEQE